MGRTKMTWRSLALLELAATIAMGTMAPGQPVTAMLRSASAPDRTGSVQLFINLPEPQEQR